jgi:hypothetical protein
MIKIIKFHNAALYRVSDRYAAKTIGCGNELHHVDNKIVKRILTSPLIVQSSVSETAGSITENLPGILCFIG